jgi:hypothetical protein
LALALADSVAAWKNPGPLFAGEWKLPLTDATRSWRASGFDLTNPERQIARCRNTLHLTIFMRGILLLQCEQQSLVGWNRDRR